MKTSVTKKKIQLKKPCTLRQSKQKKTKSQLKAILILATGTTISSCAHNSIDLHVALKGQEYCIFEKFTGPEKSIMTESIGERIYRNQQGCYERIDAINKIIRKHNKLHGELK